MPRGEETQVGNYESLLLIFQMRKASRTPQININYLGGLMRTKYTGMGQPLRRMLRDHDSVLESSEEL